LKTREQAKAGLLLLAIAWLAGCAAPTRLVQQDIYTTKVLFTVSVRAEYSALASGFGGSADSYTAPAEQLIGEIIEAHDLEKISQFPIKSMAVEAVVARIREGASLEEVIAALAQDGRVESVQSIRPYKLLTYNDPYFALQNTVSGDRIEAIHRISTGKNVSVGIVDTGVDRWHPELNRNIVYSENHVAHDQGAFDLDEHGTAVAGVIGSAANNDLGIVGVAPDVSLMVFKACHQEIASRRTACDSASIIKALTDVLAQQPDILNLSLAGPHDPIIERLLKIASRSGMVLVAAVDESRPFEASFPARMEEVIAVGTTLSEAGHAGVILAPGTDLLTTAPGATYGFKSGSSMATAYVSGIAALMKEKMPALTSAQIRDSLQLSARLDENELPVVDMCSAVNFAASVSHPSCDRARSMAVRVPEPTGPTSSAELAN